MPLLQQFEPVDVIWRMLVHPRTFFNGLMSMDTDHSFEIFGMTVAILFSVGVNSSL